MAGVHASAWIMDALEEASDKRDKVAGQTKRSRLGHRRHCFVGGRSAQLTEFPSMLSALGMLSSGLRKYAATRLGCEEQRGDEATASQRPDRPVE